MFTLEANKTYWLAASLGFNPHSASNALMLYEWVDSSDTSLNGTLALSIPVTFTSNVPNQTLATAVVTTSSSTGVKLRVISGTSGTATLLGGRSSATILQIGTTNSSLVSDRRLKREIEPLSSISDDLARLQPVLFNWRSEEYPHLGLGPGRQLGLVAQDVEKVLPQLVTQGEDGFKRISYQHIPIMLLQGI